MSTMMDEEDYRIREAIRIFQERPKRHIQICACMGPLNGEPECYCRMVHVVKVGGIYYMVSGNEQTGFTARSYQKSDI